jgi:hypothetical protein
MLGLEIWLNGRRLSVAAAKHEGVTAVIDVVDWVLPDGSRPPSTVEVWAIKDFIRLEWPGVQSLAVGDELLLKVVDTVSPDEPSKNEHKTAEEVIIQERLRYEDLKRKYGSG